MGYLEQERQWGPALGLVGGKPTIATGTVFQTAVLESAPLCCKISNIFKFFLYFSTSLAIEVFISSKVNPDLQK